MIGLLYSRMGLNVVIKRFPSKPLATTAGLPHGRGAAFMRDLFWYRCIGDSVLFVVGPLDTRANRTNICLGDRHPAPGGLVPASGLGTRGGARNRACPARRWVGGRYAGCYTAVAASRSGCLWAR